MVNIWASDYCAVVMGFVEPANKKQEHTLPADYLQINLEQIRRLFSNL